MSPSLDAIAGPERGHWSVRGLELAFHAWGAADAPLVLLLHGFLDQGRSFTPVAEQLAAGGFRAVAPDFRGHGRSGWVGAGGSYQFSDYCADLFALVEDALGAPERVTLVGHSMGGGVAMELASVLGPRVDKLVLLEGLGLPDVDPASQPDRLRRYCAQLRHPRSRGDVEERRASRRPLQGLEAVQRRFADENPRLSDEMARLLARTASEPLEAVPGEASEGERPRAWRFDPLHRTVSARPFQEALFAAVCRAVDAPTLSLFGEDSPYLDPALVARHRFFRSLRSAVLPAAAHNLHHDRPELVARTIEAWLRGRPLPPGLTSLPRELEPLPEADGESSR